MTQIMRSAPLSTSSQPRAASRTRTPQRKSQRSSEDKENHTARVQQDGGQHRGIDAKDTLSGEKIEERVFPSTPGFRISLEDLIANTEDAFNCPPPAATPGDHVHWHNGPTSSDVSASLGQPTQRSRKRARSSSPGSSQVERSVHFDGQTEGADTTRTNKTLRTPNNDPTQELWNKYMNANGSKRAMAEEPRAFAHLPPLSPMTPSTSSKDSGLRRTVSCGIEWPTSNPKRRKVELGDSHGRTKDIFAASRREILARDVPKTSRVSLLVEKIQESLARQARTDDEPSSSSPLPDKHSQMPVSQASPTRSPSKLRPPSQRRPADVPLNNVTDHDAMTGGGLQLDEFEDDGLDLEFFQEVEKSMSQIAVSHPTNQRITGYDGPQDMLPPPPPLGVESITKQTEQTALPQAQSTPKNPEFDVFDDDDTFTTELENLVAKVDSQDKDAQMKPDQPPKMNSQCLATIEELDGVFEDDDLLLQIADDVDLGKPGIGSTSQRFNQKAIKRYLIRDVFVQEYALEDGRMRPQKMLHVIDERTQMRHSILLRQSWYDTRCTKGSYVHIIGNFDRFGQCTIDDADNMIILHPDHLISATVVGDSFTCTRRAALQDRVKATSNATAPQVYGHILHELFGESLRTNQWTAQSFQQSIDKILPSYLESIYEIGVTVAAAKEYLLSKAPEMRGWAEIFVRDSISADALIRDRNGSLVPTAITKLLELEEHVWSPMHGLKGNIDATVQVKMELATDRVQKTLVVPLELKTGKKDNVETHRAQTALYTLLLSDRYDVNVVCGVLYYLETSKTFRVESVRNEIRHMIIERNELACYVHEKLDLPPMLKKPYLCKSCYSKTECFTYHKLTEAGDGDTSGLGEVFVEKTSHLKPTHAEFFRKWDLLLTKEERDTMKFRRELWTMLSTERQAVGRCFSNVVIEAGSAKENKESSKINRYEYSFVKAKPEPGFSFTDSQITIGEPIVVSDEQGHFNLASGYVLNVRPSRIVVAVDRRLQNAHRKHRGFDADSNQVFTGLMESNLDGTPLTQDDSSPQPRLYRLDKDEFANGMATARNNLIRIMENDLFKARDLRKSIVENMAPAFRASAPPYKLAGPASQQQLNVDQKAAIDKVMTAKDYALVLGMPGTGKTTTIAHIIRALVSGGKSVLLASYTHTAVDNILLKIKDDKIPILRIGAVSKVHNEVKEFADLAGVPKKSLEELHSSWHDSKVVATTCLGINHALFNARTFDYCIVDEASQITLPVCLGPIRHAQTFILVGDHYQLPPLVQNKEAQEGGLNVSLFKILSDAHPSSVVNLEHQYRMAEDIQLLASKLVYNGRLKCGTPAVASRTLHIPDVDGGLNAHHHSTVDLANHSSSIQSPCNNSPNCFLRKALAPANRCLFLNTDRLSPEGCAREAVTGSRITNATESTIIAQLVTVLIRSGVPPASIGVITFYRSQLALLKRDMKAHAGSTAAAEVEMHTADKYQGRDKEAVILSCVHSNQDAKVGELLRDWRRVNVAVTRARSKLVLVGSRGTLERSEVPILTGIMGIMSSKGWVQDIHGQVEGMHLFQPASTQTQAATQAKRGPHTPPHNPKRSPLREIMRAHNPSLSPMKVPTMSVPGGAFKKPRRIADGKQSKVQLMVDHSTVLKDIMTENGFEGQENTNVVFGGVIASSPVVADMEMEDDILF